MSSADFQKGIDAYEKGDYATALREWKPLAEQGNADAQNNLGAMFFLVEGVIKDMTLAYMRWNISASKGLKE